MSDAVFWQKRGIELIATDVEPDDCIDLQCYYNGKLFIISEANGPWDLYYPTNQGKDGVLPMDVDLARWARKAGYKRPSIDWIGRPYSVYWQPPGSNRELDVDYNSLEVHEQFPPAVQETRFSK